MASTPTPTQPPATKIPSKIMLNSLLASGMDDLVAQEIKRHKLKFRIGEAFDVLLQQTVKVVIETGDTTDAWLDRFITCDPKMLDVKKEVIKLAREQDEVIIFGETGTGKELIARALHGDKEDEFLAINCAGMPDNLIESELFGYVKGAFTGAETDSRGLMRSAASGTLFLDEVGELPLSMQAKLLRVLQSREVRPVGGTKHYPIHCRIICATNRIMDDMIASNIFRDDLYARISTFTISLAPLVDRQNDIPLILKSLPYGTEFFEAFTQQKIKIEDEEPGETVKLKTPFNVRSLQQYVRRYKVLGKLPI